MDDFHDEREFSFGDMVKNVLLAIALVIVVIATVAVVAHDDPLMNRSPRTAKPLKEQLMDFVRREPHNQSVSP